MNEYDEDSEYKWYFFIGCLMEYKNASCCLYGGNIGYDKFSFSDMIKVDGTRGYPGQCSSTVGLLVIDEHLDHPKFVKWMNNLPDEIRNSLPF